MNSTCSSSILDLVGPVLPQALRLARCQASTILPQNINELTSEKDTINQTPSPEEERLLASNAAVVTELEDLFSWREKDRTSRTSRLSRIESARFQRAIYRIWLMSELFGTRRFALRKWDSTTEDGRNRALADLSDSWKDQKAFLRAYSSQELFQIHRVARFLILTASWACTVEGYNLWVEDRHTLDLFGSWFFDDDIRWPGIFLFAGPRVILCCHEDGTTTHLGLAREHLGDYGPYTEFLTRAFHEVIFERWIDQPVGYGYVGIILDKLNGEQDRCHKCGQVGIRTYCKSAEKAGLLPVLYNETNWTELKGLLGHQSIIPTALSQNLVEEPLKQALGGDWSKLLPAVFACKDEWPEWSKEHWVCLYCWDFLLRRSLRKWRLAEKRKGNAQIPHNSVVYSSGLRAILVRWALGVRIEKDCKYGCVCEKQCGTEGLDHAKNFNHLCEGVVWPGEPGIQASEVFAGLFGLLFWGLLIWLSWRLWKWSSENFHSLLDLVSLGVWRSEL